MSSQSDVPKRSAYPTDGYSQIPPELFDEMRPVKPGERLHIGDLTMRVTSSQIVPRLHVWGAGGDSPYTFSKMRQGLLEALLGTRPIDRRTWQTLDVRGSDAHTTFELRNVSLFYTPPGGILSLQDEIKPDLPWAEAHFEERVSGQPLNPPPSYVNWPHHNGSANLHITGETFDHTYPERFWPKRAGDTRERSVGLNNQGIRFAYGDLADVVDQLVKNPMTRQAVLPVWFPEDTGATDRRVPCTLTYHFMNDDEGRLSMWYSMRACDFSRHFHNDVYFAARLLQWMVAHVNQEDPNLALTVGEVNMTISSLHLFKGDARKMGLIK